MYRLAKLSGFLFIIFMLLFGCSKNNDDDNNNSNLTGPPAGTGQGSIAITVSSGVNPTYSWSGGNVFSLTVVRTSDPTVPVWGVTVAGSTADNVATPVKHGTVPTGAIQTSVTNTEATLTAGVQYRVSVVRMDQSFGWKDFTP
ncbi:MAG: hypothetical protein Kow0042_04210 [Calditrichia bacterium]